MDKFTVIHIVNNIFLPIELPQKDESHGHEGIFVGLIADVLEQAHMGDIDGLKEIVGMMKSWAMVQKTFVDGGIVHNNIEALLPGETCALFLPKQNAGLTVSIPTNSTGFVTLAVFRVAASSSEVMGAPGDLFGTFPGWSVTTHADRVKNENFAKQVAELANTEYEEMIPQSKKAGSKVPEIRDVVNADYVTEWLLGTVAGHSLITGQGGIKRVQKKIRDDVLWNKALLPWRRSGEYMVVKIVLHSTLVGSLGEFDGLMVYKMIMLNVMCAILRKNYIQLNTDVILQILTKLARRLSKLDRLTKSRPTTSTTKFSIHHCAQENMKDVSELMIHVRAHIDEQWQRIIKQEEAQVNVDKNNLNFEKDVGHLLQTAWPHLEVALGTKSLHPDLDYDDDPKCLTRNKFCTWPNITIVHGSSPTVDIGEALYDIEIWVRDILFVGAFESNIYSSFEAKIFTVMRYYIALAKPFYKGDCLGSSQMVLTTITIIAVLDYLAGQEFTMLHEYDIGVDIDILQLLLLPLRQDMEHLTKLEAYFAQRTEKKKYLISLISEDVPSAHAFSVRLAQQDLEVMKRKEKILAFAEEEKQKKLMEILSAKRKHEKLIHAANAMACNTNFDIHSFNCHTDKYCQKCKIQKEAQNMKVNVFEFPLPKSKHLQDAVICELVNSNSSWIVVRDALHILHKDVFGVELESCEKVGIWRDHNLLQNWILTQNTLPLTTLGSTSKKFVDSHYGNLHPSNPIEYFFKPSGFNTKLMEYSTNQLASLATYKNSGNVRLETILDVYGPYKSLQWTIGSTSHTENQVLAKQVECPSELDLTEFKAFGTLRAGHRIQIRNILHAIEMQTVSLSQSSVLNLFSQALWETGLPSLKGNEDWFRESHIDLRNEVFARYALQKLVFLVENIGDNWKDHLILLNIVIIGARVLALSEPNWELVANDVLRKCRQVAKKWLEQIEQALGAMMASPVEEIQKMRFKLIDVAAIAAITFDMDVCHMDQAMKSNDDVICWLRAIAIIHDNVLLNSEPSMSTHQRNLYRRVQITALRLEKTLHEHLLKHPQCLDGFVKEHWADATHSYTKCWKFYKSPNERWWKTTFKHYLDEQNITLQVDILRGSFLVNGLPVGRLPVEITSHPDYQRVFGNHVFEVQLAAASPRTFVTVHKIKGSVFTFAMTSGSKRLVVKDRRHDKHEFELFPSRFFKDDLPCLFIEEYSHWILQNKNGIPLAKVDEKIFFRPVKFDDHHFADDAIPFELNVRLKCIQDIQRDRKLVDIRSTSFKEIYDQVLHRLELPFYVHVFVNNSNGNVYVELPRMGLNFQIKEGVLWSQELPNFFVSKKQSFGTLIGLQHGILLKEKKVTRKCKSKRSLVMPHTIDFLSIMKKHQDFGHHPEVKVNYEAFSSPRFFVFDVDDRLQCLRAPASPTAWLYLALLHAMTGHPLPDPFTKLTGTESAMRLLQSPRCWSCKPYKIESISVLLNIAKLSPNRKWYPKYLCCMQTVTWPNALFPSTALDAFHIVVEKLIEDSERLRVLFPSSIAPPILSKENRTLRLKSYWKSRNFFGEEAQLNSNLENIQGGPPVSKLANINLMSTIECNKLKDSDSRNLVEAGYAWNSIACEDHLSFLLLNCTSLNGATSLKSSNIQTVTAWRKIAEGENFANSWLYLYNLARQTNKKERQEEFIFLLSVLAFLGVQSQFLFMLLSIAIHAKHFKNIDPPEYEKYEFTKEVFFDPQMVKSEVENHKISFSDWNLNIGRNTDTYNERIKRYNQIIAQDIKALVEHAQKNWPTAYLEGIKLTTIDSSKAVIGIKSFFTRWLQNKKLHEFVLHVEKKIKEISDIFPTAPKFAPIEASLESMDYETVKKPFSYILPMHSFLPNYDEAMTIFQSGEFGVNFNKCKIEMQEEVAIDDPLPIFLQPDTSPCNILRQYKNDLEKSWNQRHKLQIQPFTNVTIENLEYKLQECKLKSTSMWNDICSTLLPSKDDLISQAMEAAGLWQRITPIVLLPWLCSPMFASDNWKSICMALGALAVIWTLEQQAERCLHLLEAFGLEKNFALQKELENTCQKNWKPSDQPEWLLLELEGNYMMRKVQIDVTNEMLKPSDAQNAVLQLNMGEGKTSVIVPALCSSISNGKQFARLTVLSSLFCINFDALAFKLGGLLNRRVYTFPCRRDMKLNINQVKNMKTVYLECISKRGVVMMQPEHRLSAQLMALELCRAGPTIQIGLELQNLLEMTNNNAGDILDESDMILQVKYQVVYTIGEQMHIDGGSLRWKIAQSVLRSIRNHGHDILSQFGMHTIEFKEAPEGSFAFPHMRLLNEDFNMRLCEMIADDILDGGDDTLPIRELRRDDKIWIRNFILDPTNKVSLEYLQKFLPEGPLLNAIMIMRGLLCYGVLMHVFRLRWRVEFGVRPSGHPKMAVPFRAKDVPVERAEYGHPDVAIMLTQISYYNSGLNDEQLLETFQRLNRLSIRNHEYKKWLIDVPQGCLPETLSDVNIDDFMYCKHILFPMLRRNMRVIDFWLSTVVFPVEAKQFEGKLVASAWDLCEHNKEGRPICGFSGTKDTKLLLPPSIKQQDLPELEGTDGFVIANLLREENKMYYDLPPCITGHEILKKVNDCGSQVLLDVGALMIELNNHDVATTWLAMIPYHPKIEAAIYFNDFDNQIMVVDRAGHETPLPLSPYHQKMDSCVVYFDDVHTRGTDLKIPKGYHACVTLGKGITKDSLVQACMRMRMIGFGHSVSFLASKEVDTSIRSILQVANSKLTSKHVLDWAIRNSVKAIKDGFRHWGSQGITHCRKQALNILYNCSKRGKSLQKLVSGNVEKEIIDLAQCYGNEKRAKPLPDIMLMRLKNVANNMKNENLSVGKCNNISNIMLELGDPIIQRITWYAKNVECFAQILDEEQERELEHEMEEEEEICRPGAATPHEPKLSHDVRLLASHGYFESSSNDFLPMLQALESTKLWQYVELNAWSNKLYVTREFATVLSPQSDSNGVDFLRPVAWLVFVPSKKTKDSHIISPFSFEPQAIVLLSSFEVNILMPEFRLGNGTHLHMLAPRLHEGQDVMLYERALILPIPSATKELFNHMPIIVQLLAFSGSAFFSNKCEQAAYSNFFGLCPRPRSIVEEEAFHCGDIQLDSFVIPEKRDIVNPILKTMCGFKKSPVDFMIDLLSARGWLGYPSSSHVSQILLLGKCATNLCGKSEDGIVVKSLTEGKPC